MIVGEHRKHFLAHKPCRLTVRDLLPCFRQRETDLPHPLDLFLAVVRFPALHSCHNSRILSIETLGKSSEYQHDIVTKNDPLITRINNELTSGRLPLSP